MSALTFQIDQMNATVAPWGATLAIDGMNLSYAPEVAERIQIVSQTPAGDGVTVRFTDSEDPLPDGYNVHVYSDAAKTNLVLMRTIETAVALDAGEIEFTIDGLDSATQYYYAITAGESEVVDPAPDPDPPSTGLNSKEGDEITLKTLYAAAGPFTDATGWSTEDMDLDNPIAGVTVEIIGGENRVVDLDLRRQNATGDIDFPEWENLKQMKVINFAFNFLDTQYPNALHKCPLLEYMYINYSDHSEVWDAALHPHEGMPTISVPVFDQGKDSGTGNNIIRGSVEDDIEDLTNLKWFVLSWSDNFGANSRVPNVINGIEDISQNIWNIVTLELVAVYDNWNIGHSGNTFEFPATIGHLPNFKQAYLGGGTGSQFDYRSPEADMMQGGYPSDLGELTQLVVFWVQNLGKLTGFPDLSGSAGLLKFLIDNNDLEGTTFPEWLVDGSVPDIDSIVMDYKSSDPKGGMTGGVPAVWNIPHLDNFNIRYHGFTGVAPTGLWDTDPAKCDIGVNNFTSLGRQDLTDLQSMVNIAWYRNEIQGEPIPYFDWGRAKQWNHIRFEQNRYVFADMLYVPPNAPNGETTFALIRDVLAPAQTFSYSPQNPAGTPNEYTVGAGGSLTIDDFEFTYSHPDNVYQWQFNSGGGWSDLSGETGINLTLTNIQSADQGSYRLRVTNPGIDDLTLFSAEIDVVIN